MVNKPPGSPEYSILSFSGGFHGRLLGVLSTTHSKEIHKVDIPAFSWPIAPFPKLRYPLKQFEKENRAEEERCLQEVENLITSAKPEVAAVVVEPIQGEGGDNAATPYFFRGLRNITKKHGKLLIVDEVQTGCGATGKFWAHEYWGLDTPPDFVTFAKKMQTAGYYALAETKPNSGYRQFNTWMGDPVRIIQTKGILQYIAENNLIENAQNTGDYLLQRLEDLQASHQDKLSRARGFGLFCAIDCPTPEYRDKIVAKLKQSGIFIGGSGSKSIRFRPMLIFTKRHVDILLSAFESSLTQTAL